VRPFRVFFRLTGSELFSQKKIFTGRVYIRDVLRFFPAKISPLLCHCERFVMPSLPRALAHFVDDLTLTNFLNKFRDYRARDPVDNHPEPDMIAARYALTGLSPNRRFVAGINTARDKLGPHGPLPFIRRDFDSLIGFSADIPVLNDVTYFPNPPLTRTLKKSVHVEYSYCVGEDVRRLRHYVSIESTDNSYSFISLSLSLCDLPGLPCTTPISYTVHLRIT